MKTEFKIIKAKDFLKARPSGEIDLEQSKNVLAQLAVLNESHADCEILIDVRGAHGHMTHADLYEFVAELGKHRNAFRNKIAFLTRKDKQFDKGRFLQLCAVNRGFKVRVFSDFEATIEWLNNEVEVNSGG